MHGGRSIVPEHIVTSLAKKILMKTGAYQVEPSSVERDQNAAASKPAHIIALPPDRMGAKRLRTMPPTWKSGIMFTTIYSLDPIEQRLKHRVLTVDIILLEIP